MLGYRLNFKNKWAPLNLRHLFFLISAFMIFPALEAKIIISKHIEKQNRKVINRDLKTLQGLDLSLSTYPYRALSLLELPYLDSSALYHWLDQRINYIVDKDADSPWRRWTARGIYSADDKDLLEKTKSAGNELSTIMRNLGTFLYLKGKSDDKIYGLKIKKGDFDYERVEVYSPKVGIIQAAEGFFSKYFLANRSKPESISNTLLRLSFLFHEARHSDGRGKNTGYLHVRCPSYHDYAGHFSCDPWKNGPNGIAAAVLKEFIKNCSECTTQERQFLTSLYIDFRQRIIVIDPERSEIYPTTALELHPKH